MPIDIPELGDDQHRMWCDLVDLHGSFTGVWTIVGAHMVALHAWEAGTTTRPSNDVDVLVDVRLAADATRQISSFLIERGYRPEITRSPLAHLFSRDTAQIDVLAPDGLGRRASITTVPTRRTVRVPGGTQALARTEQIDVRTRNVEGTLPRPSLLGALLVKFRAIEIDDLPTAQRADVATLLQLTHDPDTLRHQLTPTERHWLARHAYFGDPADPLWNTFAADDPELAATVYRRLIAR